MSNNITVTFLGTTSGGGPTETRNCSSLVVEPLGDGDLWMVDCAEGTVRQFAQQPYRHGDFRSRLRLSQVSRIFITHMHADHTMGLLTVLRNVLGIPKPASAVNPDAPPPNANPPKVEIFGPRGVRRMLRTLWHLTHTHSEHPYVVHELLFPGEEPSVEANVPVDYDTDEVDVRRESECVGMDIRCDEDGFWRGIVDVPATRHKRGVLVDAGPIEHRDPCIGYIVREIPQYELTPSSPLPRKLVLLGDTYDPSPLIPLIHSEPPFALSEPSALPGIDPTESGFPIAVPVSLLVHEATDAYLPPNVDPQQRTGKNRTQSSVEAKTRDRGHSTPAMAGAFARRIGAERLVLNHIGARFPAPDMAHTRSGQDKFRLACIREIERQAAQTWSSPARRRVYPQAAWDFLTVTIPPNPARLVEEIGGSSDALLEDTSDSDGPVAGPSMSNVSDLGTEVEMKESSYEPGHSARGAGHRGRGRGYHRGGSQGHIPIAQHAGQSVESMGARHDREQQSRHRKRGWDARSSHDGDGPSASGSGGG
ncbi:beta-lactamase-like protein [Cubamyces lactineus]|nr:beta-lactamase-like protein [Cubamyces lactineus]